MAGGDAEVRVRRSGDSGVSYRPHATDAARAVIAPGQPIQMLELIGLTVVLPSHRTTKDALARPSATARKQRNEPAVSSRRSDTRSPRRLAAAHRYGTEAIGNAVTRHFARMISSELRALWS